MSTLAQPLRCILVAVLKGNVTRNEEMLIFSEDLHYNAYKYTVTTSKYDAINRGK